MWLSDVDRAKGYAVDFLSVSLHAVSRDPEAYPSPCLYTQVITICHLINYLLNCFSCFSVSRFSFYAFIWFGMLNMKILSK